MKHLKLFENYIKENIDDILDKMNRGEELTDDDKERMVDYSTHLQKGGTESTYAPKTRIDFGIKIEGVGELEEKYIAEITLNFSKQSQNITCKFEIVQPLLREDQIYCLEPSKARILGLSTNKRGLLNLEDPKQESLYESIIYLFNSGSPFMKRWESEEDRSKNKWDGFELKVEEYEALGVSTDYWVVTEISKNDMSDNALFKVEETQDGEFIVDTLDLDTLTTMEKIGIAFNDKFKNELLRLYKDFPK